MQRLNHSPLRPLEARALDWLAPRLPTWTTPDMLTGVGVLGALVTAAGFASSNLSPHFLWLACLGLVIHWFGDSLDGSLARYRKIERPKYGFFVDQNIDVLGNLLIVSGLALSPFVTFEAAFIALTGYHMLTIYSLIDAHVEDRFRVTLLNFGPTEVRVLLILVSIAITGLGAPELTFWGLTFTWADAAVAAYGVGCMAVFTGLVVVNGRRLRAAGR